MFRTFLNNTEKRRNGEHGDSQSLKPKQGNLPKFKDFRGLTKINCWPILLINDFFSPFLRVISIVFFGLQNYAFHSVFKISCVEIKNKSDPKPRELEIGIKLGFMDR